MAKIRHIHMIYSTILDILKKKGAVNDTELYEALKERFEDIGISELNSILMSMEIRGLIMVSALTRGKRRVELANPS